MSSSELKEAGLRLKKGEVIAYPTETFYGLAVDPFNPDAVSKLLELKDRDFGQGVPLIIDSASRLDSWVVDSSESLCVYRRSLQAKFWPGPLTFVLNVSEEAKERFAKPLFGPNQTLAFRVSSLSTARNLASSLDAGVITSTSANLKGKPPSDSAAQVGRYFPEMFILEEKETLKQEQKPSTILDLSKTEPKVLREGAVSSASLLS